MARLVQTICCSVLFAFSGAAWAAERPLPLNERRPPQRSFDIVDQAPASQRYTAGEARIFAGQEVMPNGVIGFGLFGQRSAGPAGSPVTARDWALPKQRKAAVGFSLKF